MESVEPTVYGELRAYLNALRNCPDGKVEFLTPWRSKLLIDKITAELGVYDNYPILLKAERKRLREDLIGKGYLIPETVSEDPRQHNDRTLFSPTRKVILKLHQPLLEALCTGYENGANRSEEEESHFQRQISQYKMGITLYNAHYEVARQLVPVKDIADTIIDLGDYILKNSISSCFPESGGWVHRHDFSRIVYFQGV